MSTPIDLNDFIEFLLSSLHDAITLGFLELGAVWWRRTYTPTLTPSRVLETRHRLHAHVMEIERLINVLMVYHRGDAQQRTMRYAAMLAKEDRRLDQHRAFFEKISFAVRLKKIKLPALPSPSQQHVARPVVQQPRPLPHGAC